MHPAFNALDQELDRRGEGAGGTDGQGFRLNVANALWGQEDYQFQSEFLDLLAANYGAEMRRLDFAREEKARKAINDWVGQQTEDRIQELIPPGVLDAATRLVLTNAVYFNAAWARPFDPRATRDGTFHLLDGSSVTTPMMHQAASLAYTEGPDYHAVALPYDGNEIEMVVLLPAQGQFCSWAGFWTQVHRWRASRLPFREVSCAKDRHAVFSGSWRLFCWPRVVGLWPLLRRLRLRVLRTRPVPLWLSPKS